MSGKHVYLLARATLILGVALSLAGSTHAQDVRIGGFITDQADGRALEGATVALYGVDEGFGGVPAYGTATTSEGVHLISGIEPGRYLLQISFIGYEAYRDTLALAAGDVRTVTVALAEVEEALDEVLIEGERLQGAAVIPLEGSTRICVFRICG